MNPPSDTIARLHATLSRRETPETVAAMIDAAMPGHGKAGLRQWLRRVVRGSVRRYFGWSSMATVFHEPVPMERQLARARELALQFLDRSLPESDDPDEIEAFIGAFGGLIGKAPGRNSFRFDRLDRKVRAELGLGLSRRRYDKLFRLAARLERRLKALRREQARHRLILVGKAALAPDLTLEDLGDHLPTAAFIAYYAARMKLRSESPSPASNGRSTSSPNCCSTGASTIRGPAGTRSPTSFPAPTCSPVSGKRKKGACSAAGTTY